MKRYSFEELAPEAQERAIKWARERLLNDEYYWLDESLRDFIAAELMGEDRTIKGLDKGLKVYYSLGYSQGDGVALAGDLSRDEAVTLSWPDKAVRAEIAHFGHYYHERSFSVELYDEDGEEVTEGVEVFLEQLRSVCVAAERYGYDNLEAAHNEEAAREYLENNCENELTEFGSYDPLASVKVGA